MRNSSLVERQSIDNNRAYGVIPKHGIADVKSALVGEHSVDAEKQSGNGLWSEQKSKCRHK